MPPLTLAHKINQFNEQLRFSGHLPAGIGVMNPFQDSPVALAASAAFYQKYYNDTHPRHLILGINPGRFGAGVTGIPFTDSKRLVQLCGLPFNGPVTHEPSSVFVYQVIEAFGGPARFYATFYINSLSPLGFTAQKEKGRVVNYNYYDSPALQQAVQDFIIWNIQQQIALGMYTHTCICLGTGKNEAFLRRLNDRYGFFNQVVALEHPRFVMQYKAKYLSAYVNKYVRVLTKVSGT